MCTLAFSLWRNQIHNLQDLKKRCPAQNEKHWNISVLFWGWSLTTTSVWRETFIARSVTCCTHSSSETARWLEWSCLECYPIKICTSLIIRSGLHVASFMQVVRSERTKKHEKVRENLQPTNSTAKFLQIFVRSMDRRHCRIVVLHCNVWRWVQEMSTPYAWSGIGTLA